MHLDIRTLFFLSLVNGLLLGAAQLIVWRSQRHFPSLWLWSLSNFSGAAGSLLISLRGLVPDLLSIALGNTLTLIWLMLLWAGMRQFDRQPLPRWLMLAGPAVLFAAFALPPLAHNLAWRTMIMAGLTGLLLSIGTWDLWHAQRVEPLAIRRFLIFLFATAAPLCFVRLFLSAGLNPDGSFMQAPGVQAGMLVHMNLFILGWNIGGLLLVNERMQNQLGWAASRDALTGLLNQRAFFEQADALLARARIHNDPVAFILVGLKHLASYNYHLGHLGADDCLRQVGGLLEAQARRAGGVTGSLGGEQFILMLPRIPEGGISAYVEQLQSAVNEARIPHPGAPQGFATPLTAEVVSPARQLSSARSAAQSADERLLRVRADPRRHPLPQHPEVASAATPALVNAAGI